MNGNWRAVVAVFVVVAVHISGSSANDASCSAKIEKCLVDIGVTYYVSVILEEPGEFLDFYCRDHILEAEARGLNCILSALETRNCSRSLTYGPLADALNELPEFDGDRLKEALEFICGNIDALVRADQCIQWHDVDAVQKRCMQRFIYDLSQKGEHQVCSGFQLFLQSCMTIEVWPKCYAADLDVLANVIDKLVPTEDCVEVSGARGRTAVGNAALAAIITTGLVYLGLIQ